MDILVFLVCAICLCGTAYSVNSQRACSLMFAASREVMSKQTADILHLSQIMKGIHAARTADIADYRRKLEQKVDDLTEASLRANVIAEERNRNTFSAMTAINSRMDRMGDHIREAVNELASDTLTEHEELDIEVRALRDQLSILETRLSNLAEAERPVAPVPPVDKTEQLSESMRDAFAMMENELHRMTAAHRSRFDAMEARLQLLEAPVVTSDPVAPVSPGFPPSFDESLNAMGLAIQHMQSRVSEAETQLVAVRASISDIEEELDEPFGPVEATVERTDGGIEQRVSRLESNFIDRSSLGETLDGLSNQISSLSRTMVVWFGNAASRTAKKANGAAHPATS